MDAYNRPITPPNDHSKPGATTVPTSNGGITSIPTYIDQHEPMSDQRQQDGIHHDIKTHNDVSGLNTVPSTQLPSTQAPSTRVPSSGNPFVSHQEKTQTSPLNQGISTSLNNNATGSLDHGMDSSFNRNSTHTASPINHDTRNALDRDTISSFNRDTAPSAPTHRDTATVPSHEPAHKRAAPSSFDNVSTSQSSPKKHTSQRNSTTYRIENEVLRILQWKNPIRSGSIFALIVGSIIMTRWYSLLQIGSACITLAIGINLVYVNMIVQSQKVLTNQEASHPYSDVIDNEKHSMINQQSVNHYSTVITELAETVIRALTRIIFIENTMTSIKWMTIFFAIWKISAHFSTMDIVLMVVISAFTFPRLYISNKDVVDAQIQKGQSILQSGINKAQNVAAENVQNTYVKARAYVAQAGTTGTDAKNTMQKSSVTLKDEKSL